MVILLTGLFFSPQAPEGNRICPIGNVTLGWEEEPHFALLSNSRNIPQKLENSACNFLS